LHRKWLEAGRPHGGVVTIPQLGSAARRGIRAALLLDWLAAQGDPRSRFVVWGQLEAWLRAGHHLEGYTEHEVRLALGLVER
jgi:hypothetical protein